MVTGLACGFGILAVILGLLLFKLIRQIRELERQIPFSGREAEQRGSRLRCPFWRDREADRHFKSGVRTAENKAAAVDPQ